MPDLDTVAIVIALSYHYLDAVRWFDALNYLLALCEPMNQQSHGYPRNRRGGDADQSSPGDKQKLVGVSKRVSRRNDAIFECL